MKIRDEAVTTPEIAGRSISSNYDRDTVGRWSESVARFMGGGKFLIIQTLIVIAWITLNAIAGSKGLWDEYPFILLNLLFSIEAAYAAPLILLAQHRQDARDRALAERDREANARILSDSEFLTREIAAIRVRMDDMASGTEIKNLIAELKSKAKTTDESP
ncbi:MAG: hypothetical protein CL421_01745 [Acidimicrobiaceae bacterium]|nr:hypothetical protein [Acidimicrobiaceae bacterium]MBA4809401.1 DUF1003 domain-containing protein [Acidimicrobiales bacterium]OUV01642.1 MAG: hypothetical protein CBC37_00710 [Acidimicrobiaceae bacterium TMED77]|tara:strand:+ start:7681 stop:8163 length:483 start_codon:yes stop_codon:yes gene_type:complete